MGLVEAQRWPLGLSDGLWLGPLIMEAQHEPPGQGVWLWGWAYGHWGEVFADEAGDGR